MRELKIDTSKWFRGGPKYIVSMENDNDENKILSKLLLSVKNTPYDGHMCCLGFECIASGVSKEEIRNMSMPFNLGIKDRHKVAWLFINIDVEDSKLFNKYSNVYTYATSVENFLACINDDAKITDETRMELLTKFFAKYGGIQLVFVNFETE